MRFYSYFLLYFVLASAAYAGNFPSCPKGTVWDGVSCVNVCPEGFSWNEAGKCEKNGVGINGAAKCKKDADAYFASTPTGCRHEESGLIFSNRSKTSMNFRSARTYCNRIEADKKDWRLPTAEELEQVAGDTLAGSYFSFETDSDFWTIDYTESVKPEFHPVGQFAEPKVCVWNRVVNLYNGYTDWKASKHYTASKETWESYQSAYVVCVRQEQQ